MICCWFPVKALGSLESELLMAHYAGMSGNPVIDNRLPPNATHGPNYLQTFVQK